MENVFNDIIEKDEKIIKVFKPNKMRYWFGIILGGIGWLFATGFWFILPLLGAVADEPTGEMDVLWFISIGFVAIFALVLLVSLICSAVSYRNRFYAYSNKRILIRSGIIGIDYRTLEFQSLTATNVRVSFLDKILGTKTGTIEFASPSSPIGMGYNGARVASPYAFKGITQPYDTLREIKERIDKSSKKK